MGVVTVRISNTSSGRPGRYQADGFPNGVGAMDYHGVGPCWVDAVLAMYLEILKERKLGIKYISLCQNPIDFVDTKKIRG